MRKTNVNIKRIKFVKRMLIKFILGQIVILLVFVLLFQESKPIDINSCTNTRIIVEDKEYTRVYQEYKCRIFSNGIRYDFYNTGSSGKYTSKELYEKIVIGEILDISYINRYGFFGKYNLIVDAKDETNIYLDFNSYNLQKEKANISVIIMFSIIELVFLSAFIVAFIFNRKELKIFLSKKKKHKL